MEKTTTTTARNLASQAEDLAKRGLKAVKTRARRRDRVGDATYRALELVSDGLGVAAKKLGQLGEATQPPARGNGQRATLTTGAKPRPAAARKSA